MDNPNRGLDKSDIMMEKELIEIELDDEKDNSVDNIDSFRMTTQNLSTQTNLIYKKNDNTNEDEPNTPSKVPLPIANFDKPKRIAKKRVTRLRDTALGHEAERSISIGSSKLEYGNNYIKTNKYSLVTFVPLNLLEQFSKPANIYFLFIAALQCIPDASITNGLPIIFIPLSFIVLLTAIKDLAEDLKKYMSDKEENHTITQIVSQKEVKPIFWQDIFSGDVIEIRKGQYIPADCLLLYSSNTEQNQCFVETKNLDGETNLKKKLVVSSGRDFSGPLNCINYFLGSEILFEKENPNMQIFEGRLVSPQGIIRLSLDNVLLRGTSLQNTDFIYGICLSAG